MSAQAVARYLERTDPVARRACELAVALSPAAFVEPSLLRAVRVKVLPHLTVEVEADLWFSPLVKDRTPDGMSFEPDAVALLQQRLLEWLADADRRERAERAAAVILGREAPELRRVGEHVTWWSLSQGDGAHGRIALELAPVLHALREQRHEYARWARRTLPRLPAGARQSPAVWEAAARASSISQEQVDVGASPVKLFETTMPDLPRVELPIRRRGGALDVGAFRAERALGIQVPDTRPMYLAVIADGQTHILTVLPGEARSVDVGRGVVSLRTLSGDIYRLDPEPAPQSEPHLARESESIFSSRAGRDVVVVIPGLFGSRLERKDLVLWGGWSLSVLGKLSLLRELVPPQDDSEDDQVRATDLIPDMSLIPGLWSVTGYSGLLRRLGSMPRAKEGQNLFAFPWDWRRDVRLAARQLRENASLWLSRWREQSGISDPRLVLVAHAEGGLVAAEFLEQLGGWEDTRLFMPVATPFRGTVRALEQLVNGFRPGLGPLSYELTPFIRSLMPLYQILPTYPCVDLGDGELRRVQEIGVPNVNQDLVLAGGKLLNELHALSELRDRRLTAPVVGIGQRTPQSAQLIDDRIKVLDSIAGQNWDGDGVVTRFSAVPAGSEDDPRLFFIRGRHGEIQGDRRVLDFIQAALDAQGPEMLGRTRRATPLAGHVDMADAFRLDEEISGLVQADHRGSAQLVVHRTEDSKQVARLELKLGREPVSFALRLHEEGIYRATLLVGNERIAEASFVVIDQPVFE